MTSAPTRKWLPTDWQDEVTPPPAVSPSDFIQLDADGPFLAPLGWKPDTEELAEHDPRIRLEDGTLVQFSWVEDHGHRTLTVLADGSWTLDEPFPDAAEQFWLPGDPDTINLGIDDLVRGSIDGWSDPLPPGDWVVAGYTWGPHSVWRYHAASNAMVQAGEVH